MVMRVDDGYNQNRPKTQSSSGSGGKPGKSGGGETGKPKITVKPAPKPKPPAPKPKPKPPAPKPKTYSSGGGGGGSSNSTARVATVTEPEPPKEAPKPPPPPSLSEYLAKDSEYQASTSSAKKAHDEALAAIANRRLNYYSDTSQDLFKQGLDFDSVKNADGTFDTARLRDEGRWNAQDRSRSYGSGLANMQDSAASRGMMNSTGYGDNMNQYQQAFSDMLNNILTAIAQSETQFSGDTTSATSLRDNTYNSAARVGAAGYANRYGVENPSQSEIDAILKELK